MKQVLVFLIKNLSPVLSRSVLFQRINNILTLVLDINIIKSVWGLFLRI